MKDMGIRYGSKEQAVPLIIGKDTVYEHTEIEQVFEDQDGNSVDDLFKYHEIQYDKDEYIKIITERNANIESQLTDVQLALVELYEGVM